MLKPKAIILLGPTASGKTNMAVRLARTIQGEIISADSRQVFRDMDIGTGKDLDEYGTIPYHLINVVNAGAEFSVSDFQILARKALSKITGKGRFPIICGGSGHYVKALLEDYEFDYEKTNLNLSRQLEARSREELYQTIKSLGLWNNHHWEKDSKRRMARAIEKKAASSKERSSVPSFSVSYDYKIFFTNVERFTIKSKIKRRLLQRFEEGMIEETKKLLEKGISHQRLERYGLEYKYISFFLRNRLSFEELVEKLGIEISRFAKRQMTFLRYLERSGHHLVPVANYEELWGKVSNWLGSISIK